MAAQAALAKINDLWCTTTAPLPFMADVVVRSFVIEEAGAITLIYNSPGIDASANALKQKGKPKALLINHWHEAMYGQAKHLALPTYVSNGDRKKTEKELLIAGTLEDMDVPGNNIKWIYTPGHTAGAVAFIWTKGACRYLFCGDTIWLNNDRWEAVVLAESDRKNYIQSLEMLAQLDFNVLVPWVSLKDGPFIDVVTEEERREQLGNMIARLRAGEDA